MTDKRHFQGRPVRLEEAFPTMPIQISNHRPTMAKVERLHGPLAFRALLGVSALQMHDALVRAGCSVQTHQTVYTWERPERCPDELPRGYWRRYRMPAYAVDTYHRLIVAYIEWLTDGRYTARVAGKRVWHITLKRAA